MGPHRTFAYAVNVRDLERFDAGTEITPESLVAAGLVRNTRFDLKILGDGELTKKLSVSAHSFSKTAREKIEKAGGSITWLRGEPKPKVVRKRKPKPVVAEEETTEAEETEAAEEPEAEDDAELAG